MSFSSLDSEVQPKPNAPVAGTPNWTSAQQQHDQRTIWGMSDDGVFFHFRPDLLEALVSAVGLLNKSKPNVLNLFRGAGVPPSLMAQETEQVRLDKNSISKFTIARNILLRLNELGDKPDAIRQRREVARRVSEWEDFSTCWPNDELAAKGAVQDVRRIINVHDSFTRMKNEKEKEAEEKRREKDATIEQQRKETAEFEAIQRDFYALFGETTNPQKRGKEFEGVMNRLFAHAHIKLREAFTVTMDETGKALEQIDAVVELDNRAYLVEMKWEKNPIDVPTISHHLNRVFMRKNSGDIRGMYISASGYTGPTVETVKKAKIAGAFVFLCTTFDLFTLLEHRGNLAEFCRARIVAADVDENPFLGS